MESTEVVLGSFLVSWLMTGIATVIEIVFKRSKSVHTTLWIDQSFAYEQEI